VVDYAARLEFPARFAARFQGSSSSNDVTYLPTLVQLMDSDSKEIQNAAAEAAGNLGGSSAVPQLASLISSPNVDPRLAGTNSLGNSHADEAVPLLIGMLVILTPTLGKQL
jgi:HEAT repeat protein